MIHEGASFSLERSAVFGSTLLTRMLLEYLDDVAPPQFVLGLSPEALTTKANGVDLRGFCHERRIPHQDEADWPHVAARLRELEVNTVLVFGDSRIVPEEITSGFAVVGNHGALLPDVRGGASLVWGRMADLGYWGVSVFRLTAELDGGEILGTRRFDYDSERPMREFVELADRATIEVFRLILEGEAAPAANLSCVTRIQKGVDSHEGVVRMRAAMANGEPVYMPIRTPADAFVNPEWPPEFRRAFMIANDSPYPRWTTEPIPGASA